MNIRYHLLKYISLATGNDVYKNYQKTLQWDNFSEKEVNQKQEKLLEDILLYSYQQIPYYKKIFDQIDLISNNQVDLDMFNQIPILTKDMIRENFNDLLAPNWKELGGEENTSGGSTGEPVKFIQGKNYKAWNYYASKLYYNKMLGKEMGEKEANIWGSERDILRGNIGLDAKITNFLYNRIFLNSFTLTEEKLFSFVEKINKFKPKSMWCYVESLFELAKFIKENNLKIHSPEIIISTAGTLTPEVRDFVEEVFETKVYNQYGSREVGPIACQCKEHKNMHTFPWANYVEIVDEKNKPVKPSEEGYVLVSTLTNKCMPLIRYKIGDMAIKAKSNKCTCGRNTAKIKEVTGRVISHFYNNDGTKVHGQYFIHLFYFQDWVKKFQVLQEEYDKVVCRVVKEKEPNQEDIKKIENKIKKVMGENCQVEFSFVKGINPSKSGKYLYTISRVK
jgi:phenylacetate-CoA ligase